MTLVVCIWRTCATPSARLVTCHKCQDDLAPESAPAAVGRGCH